MKNKKVLIVISTIGVCLILIGVLVFVMLKTDDKNNQEQKVLFHETDSIPTSSVFYEDEEYRYHLLDTTVGYEVRNQGKTYTLNEALQQKIITLKDIKKQEIEYAKEPKFFLATDWSVIKTACPKEPNLIMQDESISIYFVCIDDISIKKGNETKSLKQLLLDKEVTIQEVVSHIKFVTEMGQGSSTVYKDGGSVLYEALHYRILKCNTLVDNRDVYIGDETLSYESTYCITKE